MVGKRGEGLAYGVQEGAALDLGGTTAGVVDVVALHGDVVVGAIEVDTPVVVAVAGGGVVGGTVDVAVGDGHALGGRGTQDNVLTANASSSNVVDPDHVAVVNGDGITAPHVLGVDVGDGDVPGKIFVKRYSQLLSSGVYTYWMMMLLAPLTIRRPLPLMIPAEPEPRIVLSEATVIPSVPALSLVNYQYMASTVSPMQGAFHLLGNGDGGSARLVILAPGVLVNGNLASRRGTPGSATSASSGTLGATEVKGLGQDNDTSLTITKVRDQLAGGRRVDGSSRATTGDTLGETLGGARDADSSSVGSESCNQCSELHSDNEGPK